jgi:hypothetical protein
MPDYKSQLRRAQSQPYSIWHSSLQDRAQHQVLRSAEGRVRVTWELVGRLAVIFGVAGLVGVVGRRLAIWLRAFYKSRSR